MIGNYLKIAFRNIVKNKTFSFINIFGLSVGLATCLLLLLYIFDEMSYDNHHKDGSQIYRLAIDSKGEKWAGTAAPIAQGLKKDFPEVKEVTRILNFPTFNKMLLKNGKNNKQFYETNGYYADASFFNVFTYHFTKGDSHTALNGPNTLVLSEDIANKMFGSEDPIGKVVSVEIPFGKLDYTVNGVFRNNQNPSHINAHFFLSMKNGDVGNWVNNQTQWSTNNIFYTYIKLKKGTNVQAFQQKFQPFLSRNGGSDLAKNKNLFLQPLQDIHLKSAIGHEISANGSMTYLYIFGSIAVFLLLIACINFMNLSTAKSEKRAKEVGVRKVMGANKPTLIWQFLAESLMMCLIALFLSLLLVVMFLPSFNAFTQKNITFFKNPMFLYWIAALTLFTGLLSGLYPALYLSSFQPIAILKGKLINSISATFIRKGLVVFQFAISASLILVTVIIWQQLALIKNQDLGFTKNQQLVLPFQSAASANNYASLKSEVLKNPNIASASAGSSYPGIQLIEDQLFYAEGKTTNDKVDIHFAKVYDDYIETLGYKILYGRSISKNSSADSNAIILNETAIKQLGYTANTAIGRKIFYEQEKKQYALEIIGVVKDFNYHSLHEAITPYGITRLKGEQPAFFIATMRNNNVANAIADIEKIWKKLNPETPFEYSFLDEDFQRSYAKEARISGIVIYFTIIAIFIACLGLLGLASFTAEQRKKEVGIRKVLGASVLSITTLLSIDFIKLVMIGIIIASPVSYYLGTKWLQGFVYRININWWTFAAAGVAVVLIAFATISFQAIKSALANPVKSLRTE